MVQKEKSLSADKQGKFIAIYGINGIGKTTQVEILVDYLKKKGKKAFRLKYPIYELEPEGPFIYKYLRDPGFREKNELSTHKLQKKYAENRMHYEPLLRERLKKGEWIIAEDYTGTGISWGLTWGGDLAYLEDINEDLLKPDLEILLDGNRFFSAIEKDHRNEMSPERIMICKNFHNLLSVRYNWERVNPKQKMEIVHEDILKIINKYFKLT